MIINAPPEFFVKAVWVLLTVLLLLVIYYLVHIGNNFIPERKRIRVNNSKVLPLIGLIIGIYFFGIYLGNTAYYLICFLQLIYQQY